MTQWTIGKRIVVGFASVLTIIAILGSVALIKFEEIKADANIIAIDCLPGMYYSGQLEMVVKDNYAHTFKHVIAQDKPTMDAIEAEMKATSEEGSAFATKYESTITASEDRDLFAKLSVARAKFLDIRNNTVLPLSRQNKTDVAMAAIREKLEPAYQEYLKTVRDLVEFNHRNGETAGERISHDVHSGQYWVSGGLALSMLLGVLLSWLISRSVNRRLQDLASGLRIGASQTSSASMQVASASQALAGGASEQASSLEETSASLEELSSMTRQNADTAQQAHSLAKTSVNTADGGKAAMERMTIAINRIKNSSDQTAKILKTIDEIAFQTNLLALNAAVEAARAGDAGKGFAVVAEEVRNLAQRSAEAARSTAALIEESRKNADSGVSVSGEVAQTLGTMGETAGKLQQMVHEVAEASAEQAKGIEQINTAVSQMDKITQSNASSAEESASASEELSAQARELDVAVNELLRLVGGNPKESKTSTQSPSIVSIAPKENKMLLAVKVAPQSKHVNTNGNEYDLGHSNRTNRHARSNVKRLAEKAIPLNDVDMTDY
jgi:methyl-accepting chemotaxis protein